MEPEQETERKPCCRYCGELSSAYLLGRSADCRRWENIREHSDTFLHSDDEILPYAQDRLRRKEKVDDWAEQAERWTDRQKALDRRMGRSGTLVADRPKPDQNPRA